MIAYVGDLSRADALVLRELAGRAEQILEFGSGASTQLFAAYGRGAVTSIETDPAWIAKTRHNLAVLGIGTPVDFREWAAGRPVPARDLYDLIFVDGVDELRQAFALATWSLLRVGGVMVFHDTRRTAPHGDSRTSDVQNVCAVLERYALEIDQVRVNRDESNLTLVTKRERVRYVNWNEAEGRTLAQIGLA